MLGPLTAIAAVGILALAGCGGDLTTSAHKPTRAELVAKRKHERAVYVAVCVTNGGRKETCRAQLRGEHTRRWRSNDASVKGKRAAGRQRAKTKQAYLAACVAASEYWGGFAAEEGCRKGWDDEGSDEAWGQSKSDAADLGTLRGEKLARAAERRDLAPNPSPEPSSNCDPNYEGVCVPDDGYDYNCPDIDGTDFPSVGTDPHGLDRDGDGIACES